MYFALRSCDFSRKFTSRTRTTFVLKSRARVLLPFFGWVFFFGYSCFPSHSELHRNDVSRGQVRLLSLFNYLIFAAFLLFNAIADLEVGGMKAYIHHFVGGGGRYNRTSL